ncbi:MAG: pilin [Candidatus Pacebacteria bacterium]|nr:pilin [Candidatus Paceibacterota bacterium]
MKKVFAIVLAISLMAGVFGAVAVAMAQDEQLQECCHLNQGITIDSTTYNAKDVVGQKGGACDLNNDGKVEEGEVIPDTATGTNKPAENWGMICLLNTVYTVTNWVFYIMTIVAVLMIVFGGFTYITAAGDPTKAGKGKGILTFAIIGLAIALIAKLIPSLVRFILGM